MKKRFIPIIATLSVVFHSSPSIADAIPVKGKIIRTNYSSLVGKEKELEVAENVQLVEQRVISEIHRNETISEIRFNLISPQHTGVKLKWNDDKIAIRSNGSELHELHSHIDRTFFFTAYGETSGHIEVYNVNDELLLTIPYKVVKQKTIRQTIRSNVKSSLENVDPTVTLGYSLSTVKQHSTDGSWSFRTSVSGIGEEINLNIGTSYSW